MTRRADPDDRARPVHRAWAVHERIEQYLPPVGCVNGPRWSAVPRAAEVRPTEPAHPVGPRGGAAAATHGLRIEPDLGLLLPCNVVVRVDQDGTTLVSALDPELLVSVPGRPELAPVAAEAKTRLQTALAAIAATTSRDRDTPGMIHIETIETSSSVTAAIWPTTVRSRW